MAGGAHGTTKLAYPGTFAMLGLALAFPIGLMVFNPTLMFERGWEQYVGTAIYAWAVLTLARELAWLWKNEQALEDAPTLLEQAIAGKADAEDRRILPARLRQLSGYVEESGAASVTQLMELNREGSGLDQEQASGRFTLTRYILYLLPVIGFIGTVEGISRALMNISKVLPMVKDLDGFMNNLTGVTSALQIAFDSTLLALFLSAALMLVQTLVFRRSEDLLARIDRWVVDKVLPEIGDEDSLAGELADILGPQMDQLRQQLAAILEPATRALEAQAARWGERLGAPIDQFAKSVDRLPIALSGVQRGAEAIGKLGGELERIGDAGESLRRGATSLGRIESTLGQKLAATDHLTEIKEGIGKTCAAVESLSQSWTVAYERSSRATQEQLARTLNSLKDAIELLNVSMEQGNALYRNIVKNMARNYTVIRGDEEAA